MHYMLMYLCMFTYNKYVSTYVCHLTYIYITYINRTKEEDHTENGWTT